MMQLALPWQRLRGRTVLITGANGFLAGFIVEALLHANETQPGPPMKVLGLVRNLRRAEVRFAHHRDRRDLEFIVQDVTRPLPEGVRADFILHAASQASPKCFGSDPVGTLSANVLGTHHLLEAARAGRAERLLFMSSGEVYGRVSDAQVPTREGDYGYVDPTDVRSCYAEGKRLGETMCVSWWHQYGVGAVIARPFHTYGPGMRLDDGRVFADFVADVVARRPVRLTSDGSARRAFCYVADAVAGFLTVLLKGEPGQAYNVGNEAGETSIRDLARLLAGLFPERGLSVCLDPPPIAPGYLVSKIARNCPDTSKVRALGWQPRMGLEDGFRRTIRSFE